MPAPKDLLCTIEPPVLITGRMTYTAWLSDNQIRLKKSVIINMTGGWIQELLNDLLKNVYAFVVSTHHECIQIIFCD